MHPSFLTLIGICINLIDLKMYFVYAFEFAVQFDHPYNVLSLLCWAHKSQKRSDLTQSLRLLFIISQVTVTSGRLQEF